MITVQILEAHDVIEPTDFGRQLSLTFDGQSDYLATNNTYSGARMNRLGWMPADEVCAYWVGKTVGEFNAAMTGFDRHDSEMCAYEFIRGPIPVSHMEVEP